MTDCFGSFQIQLRCFHFIIISFSDTNSSKREQYFTKFVMLSEVLNEDISSPEAAWARCLSCSFPRAARAWGLGNAHREEKRLSKSCNGLCMTGTLVLERKVLASSVVSSEMLHV